MRDIFNAIRSAFNAGFAQYHRVRWAQRARARLSKEPF